jgi:hypothetical protein
MFTLIQDTREQEPWDFAMDQSCGQVIRQGLTEGDYTTKEILDLEISSGRKIFRVERKLSTGELSTNLGKHYKRFLAEMERLSAYEKKYLIFEFTIDDLFQFPKNSGIPEKYWKKKSKDGRRMVNALKVSGKLMYARIKGIEEKYGLKVIYAGSRTGAMDAFTDIAERVHYANFG